MNICFFTLSSAFGGLERHTLGLAKTLSERGNNVTIVQLGHDAYDQIDQERYRAISVERVDVTTDLSRLSLLRCITIIRRWKGAVCVFPKGWFPHGSITFDLVTRLTCRRYITIEHSRAEAMPPKSSARHFGGLVPGIGLWWYRKLVMGRARSLGPNRIVCVSESVKKGLVELYHFPERKLISIVNGADTDEYRFTQRHRVSIRRALKISQDALVFGFVGRLSPIKNVGLAIRCFGELFGSREARGAYFLIVGDGPCARDLQLLTEDLGLGDRVIFQRFTERPWEIYSALDVLLMPSLNEGFGLALIEAMACQCCAIATDAGGMPEVISDPTLGWLVPQGDANAFLGAMRESICSGREALRVMGLRARRHVMSNFNSRVQYPELARLIEGGCGASRV